MTFPTDPPPVPAVVSRIAAGRDVEAVWVNEVGGVTFRVGDDEYVKTAPPAWSAHLAGEVDRMRWAARYVTVPQVLGSGDGWLHTVALPGRSAVDPHWLARPREAAHTIGEGLRLLHDRLPVADCPFELAWSASNGLGDPPPIDRLVVCHGDACAPNTLIGDDGRCSGHVDLGDLGVADEWSDLAVATLSLGWNYAGGPWDGELLDAYGVAPDAVRIAYYRQLWEAGEITSR
jgi:kanamycin kinase